MTASPAPHLSAAVHSHEAAPCLAANLGRSVLRRLPARAFGVILSAADVLRSAEAWAALPVSSLDLRAALPGAARLLGSLIPSACQGLRFFAFAYRVPAYLHLRALPVDEQSTTGSLAWTSPKFGRFILRSAA